MDMEQRIFELLDGDLRDDQIIATVAREYGVSRQQVCETGVRVIKERGTPGLALVRKSLEELRRIHFV